MELDRRIMIIAGEVSGDSHGARLVRAMQRRDARLSFFGIGGGAMKRAGVEIRVDHRSIAVVGLSEVLTKLGRLWKALRKAKYDLRNRRPDLLILIDFPDFNLYVASTAQKLGIPVLYYISPQIWAWRMGRLNKIKRVVDHMVVIFPFEESFYRQAQIPVTFVGHPLLDEFPVAKGASTADDMETDRVIIGCLPGSRNEEVRRLLPVMVRASEQIAEEIGGCDFIIPLAPSVDRALVDTTLEGAASTVHVVVDRLEETLRKSVLLITASGTVTLEAALAGTPMIIIYKVSRFSYRVAKHFIRVKHIGLPNLIAGRSIVPELIQQEASADNIARWAVRLLRDKRALSEMRSQLVRTAQKLGTPGASERAAEVALSMLSLTKA